MTDALSILPAVGVGAIVFDRRGRVLLIRRGLPPRAGWWSVPGGRLEPGESLKDCCRREVLEETGLAIEPGPIVAVAERQGEGFHYVILDFAAKIAADPPPVPCPASDAADARWVALGDLDDYTLVEGLKDAILAAFPLLEPGSGAGLRDRDSGRLYLPAG
jgi:ADP-ribose pyrophosphatase YjhB (NUDIX family)